MPNNVHTTEFSRLAPFRLVHPPRANLHVNKASSTMSRREQVTHFPGGSGRITTVRPFRLRARVDLKQLVMLERHVSERVASPGDDSAPCDGDGIGDDGAPCDGIGDDGAPCDGIGDDGAPCDGIGDDGGARNAQPGVDSMLIDQPLVRLNNIAKSGNGGKRITFLKWEENRKGNGKRSRAELTKRWNGDTAPTFRDILRTFANSRVYRTFGSSEPDIVRIIERSPQDTTVRSLVDELTKRELTLSITHPKTHRSTVLLETICTKLGMQFDAGEDVG